jgi:hypothetical protein
MFSPPMAEVQRKTRATQRVSKAVPSHAPHRDRKSASRVSWDFSRLPIYAPEAMRGEPASSAPHVGPPSPTESAVLDRRLEGVATAASHSPAGCECAACGSGDSSLTAAEIAQGKAPPSVREVLGSPSPGERLDALTGRFMEQRFGYDFDRVRVHSDTRSAQSAADIGARAWTLGSHVFFGPGAYDPASPQGAALIAHELAHVVQQRNQARPLTVPPLAGPHEHHERDVETQIATIARGGRPALAAPVASPLIQRSLLSSFLDVVLFVPRLFGLEVFPAEDLREYLRVIRERKGPEDKLFSDNKARACVARESEFGPYDTQTKIWLVQEMSTGHVSFLDEGTIIDLLRRSSDRQPIVAAVGRDRLWSVMSGRNRRIIEALTLTTAEAGDALVSRLRNLSAEEIQDYASNAIDPAVRDAARRAAALTNITAPVPSEAAVSATGTASFVINGVQVTVDPDRINPSLGNHAFTYGEWQPMSVPAPITITPENQNLPVNLGPEPYVTTLSLRVWTEFASEEAKTARSGYGVGTRPQDQPTLRFHERAHGEGWFTFLRNNPPPVFTGASGMLPAQYNAAVAQFEAAIRAYKNRAGQFALQAGDCVGTLPTEEQLAGTGFTAAICRQQ